MLTLLIGGARSGKSRFAESLCADSKRVLATHLHGFLDSDSFRHSFLRTARQALDLNPDVSCFAWKADRERRSDRIPDEVAAYIDLLTIFGCLNLPYRTKPQTQDQTCQ